MIDNQTILAWRALLIIAKDRGDDEIASWLADRILDALTPKPQGAT